MKKNSLKIWEFVLRLSASAAIIIFIFKFVPYKKLLSLFERADKRFLFLSFACFFLTNLIAVWRWQGILRNLGMIVKFKDAFVAYFSGLFFNLFFPSFLAGDIFRSVSLGKGKEAASSKQEKSAASVLIDRLGGFLALSAIAFCFYWFLPISVRTKSVSFSLGILFLLSAFALFFSFSRRFFSVFLKIAKFWPQLFSFLEEFHRQTRFFRHNFKMFLKVVGISFIVQALSSVSFILAGLAFGVKINYYLFFLLVPIISVVVAIPITVGGLGTREAAALFFLGQIGIGKTEALGISLMNFVNLSGLGILGGAMYALFYHRWLQSYKKKSPV